MSLTGLDKIVLGTAQFGMQYGINNKRGKVPRQEVYEILNKAVDSGIDTFDTAYDYGESEEILGGFIKSCDKKIKVISKLPVCKSNEVKALFYSSLNRLGIPALYGYLIHNYSHYSNDFAIWDELKQIKEKGKIEKIGFSLYFPSELDFLFKQGLRFDLVQVPFSIFDRRFEPYFPELKKRKVEILVRSVFLQGIVFKKASELNGMFALIRDKIRRLNVLSAEAGIPITSLCMGFVLSNTFTVKAVLGIDNLTQLEEIISFIAQSPDLKHVLSELSKLREDNEAIILPFRWALSGVGAS